MDREQFFNNIFDESGDAAEAIRFQRQLSFEERIVKRAFKDCGIKVNSWGKLVNECKAATGLHKLNFQWFNTSTRFPVRLCGRRIPKLHELKISEMFKPAPKNRLFNAVIKTMHKLEVDDTQGFLFVFPLTRTMYCAHNVTDTQSLGPHWTMVTPQAILTVEPVTSFFQMIGPEWYLG